MHFKQIIEYFIIKTIKSEIKRNYKRRTKAEPNKADEPLTEEPQDRKRTEQNNTFIVRSVLDERKQFVSIPCISRKGLNVPGLYPFQRVSFQFARFQ